MTEPISDDPSPLPPQPPPPIPTGSPRKRRRWMLILAGGLLTPVVLAALYIWVALTWSYSDGDRAGALYKFSRKGWICKTWEGELNLTPSAAAPTIWLFTVRDDAVAQQINQALGQNVVLHYGEHRGIPTSCFGETQYHVDAVRVSPAPR